MKNYLKIYDNGDSAVRVTDLEEQSDLGNFDLCSEDLHLCCPLNPKYEISYNTDAKDFTSLFALLLEHITYTKVLFGKESGSLDLHGQEFTDEAYVDEEDAGSYWMDGKKCDLNKADFAVKIAVIRAAFDDGYLSDDKKEYILMNSNFDITVVPLTAYIHSEVSVRPYQNGGRLFGFAWSEALDTEQVKDEVRVYNDWENGAYSEVSVKSVSLKDGELVRDEYCSYYRTDQSIWDTVDFETKDETDEISDGLFEALKATIDKRQMRGVLQNGELEV